METLNKKPLVYIASPYSRGEVELNVKFQCLTYERLRQDDKVFAICPLWLHFQDETCPPDRDLYETNMAWCFKVIERCDALLCLNAIVVGYRQYISSGRDREVVYARQLNKPVFYEIEELYEWCNSK